MLGDDGLMGSESSYWLEPDFLLADLVSGLVNRGGMHLGITLFLHGLVITGTLVSEQEYLQSLSRLFKQQARKSFANPTAEDLRMAEELFDFTGLVEDDGLANEAEGEEQQESTEPPYLLVRHLHLKDPMVLQPQPTTSFAASQFPIMRIRLGAIDGWMVGKVTVEDALDDFSPSPDDIRH